MSTYQALDADALLARLKEKRDTLILFHRNPDADAVGSAFALKQLLTLLGSRAFCLCPDPVPERLRFLCQDEQAGVAFEDIPADFSPSARVISVDSASPSQLGSLYARFEGRIDLMIDHHGAGETYADSYIRPTFAATGEILFDLATRLESEGQIKLTKSICVLLYAAISADTGCFRFSNVTPKTHLRAAALMEYGIDCAEINHRLYDSNSMEQLRAQAAGIANLRLCHNGALAIIPISYAMREELGLSDEHFSILVDVARSVLGVQVAVSIRQPSAEGLFRVSMRSSSDYDVSAICAKFGGGGHKKAAGCTIQAETIEDVVARLVAEISL